MTRTNMGVIPFLALKDLRRDVKIVVLVVFLIAFSYINLTFFPSFLNGLSNTFQDEIIDTGTSHIFIRPKADSNERYLKFVESIRKKIELIPGVTATTTHTNVPIKITSKKKELSISAIALTPSEERLVTIVPDKIVEGSFLSDNDRNSIILGRFIAGERIEDTIGRERFGSTQIVGLGGVRVGETVTVEYANGVRKKYRVKGIVESEGFGTVGRSVFITRKEADTVLGLNDKVSNILVKLDDRNNAGNVKRLILDLSIKGADILTWREALSFTEGINQTFSVVNLVTTIVGIVIVISTVGIVIFINTSRKKRIIGVLKALGMTKHQIMYIFMFESVLFGIVGTLIGFGLMSIMLFYFKLYPIMLPLGALRPTSTVYALISAGLTVVLSAIIAGYIPSRIASKQDILQTIRTLE